MEQEQNGAKTGIITGIISVNSKGIGFIEKPNKKSEDESDVEIKNEYLHTALHKDEVEVKLLGKEDRGRELGEVVKIVNRNKMKFVGRLEQHGLGFAFVADDNRLYVDINVPGSFAGEGKSGDKVYVEIVEWIEGTKSPIGKVIEVIGKHGEHNTEMRAIILERGIACEFPKEVEEEAEEIGRKEKITSPAEIATRRDFRTTTTFTIDPIDAKDFDDAISFKQLDNGHFEIGVHIADVSHYVREGSELDKEARSRGLSTYLVDRTIPMLPEILSNGLCSLNAHEDKCTFSAVFDMDATGVVHKRWFGKTMINSYRRFTYEDAQANLTAKSGDYFEELDTLNKIAYKLREERGRNGAIDFEQDEVKFQLDDTGKPIRVFRKKRFDAHKLVEEFMLLANREVALYMYQTAGQKNGSFVYRIHDTPDEDRIAELALFVKALGYSLPVSGKKGVDVKDIQKLLKDVEGQPEEALIKTAAVRSMAKAVYAVDNIGHFGLAFDYYTHFTSPIRRYADLLVHRLLFRELTNGKIAQGEWSFYKKLTEECSEKEVRSSEAERASIKYKQVEYMKERIGKIFEGTISGVTEWGIYIEDDETRSEGMIRLKDLGNDYFALDKKKYAIVGEKSKKVYRLGDKVKFKILNTDVEKKTIDMGLVE